MAIQGGQLEAVKWLCGHSCPGNHDLFVFALQRGEKEILDYLIHSSLGDQFWDEQVLFALLKEGDRTAAKLAREMTPPVPWQKNDLSAMDLSASLKASVLLSDFTPFDGYNSSSSYNFSPRFTADSGITV